LRAGALAEPDSAPFARFVRELEAQSPEPVEILEPDLTGASDADREVALFAWAFRVVDEHRSAVRFTEVLRCLLEMDAPYPALAAMQRLIGDELRHARLCARFASRFGPIEKLRIELDGLGWPGDPRPPAERALEIIVRELVIGEGESIACLKAYRRAATDPAAQRVLDVLLTDEARHYATGQHLEALMLERWPELRPFHAALEPVLSSDVRSIRAQHRSDARGGPGRAFGASIRLHEAPPEI
jgi:hypothetical protein